MNKKILVIVLALAMLALPIYAVSATKPYEVSGTIDSGITGPPSSREAGINTFMYFNTASEWIGDTTDDISGITVGTQTWIIHNNEKNPHVNIPDVELFFTTATVKGLTGTLKIRMRLLMANPALNPNLNFPVHGTWQIIDATGELEGLHGQGTWGGGWYAGTLHFAP
ncbi:hypothetical protein AC477_03860 [miscellaneous Crenarchaeota group-1 archaeon SG8-32-1]|uniref:Uncharacterized protein n=1 Tax=miscellaneous Crenarchaeota group-1 archaeon SG8-32-1 TaxID=1685124 RepID=A0A0M0BT35_9ARCH|nr:MAG: hypothetical protein AC477_03860 [miscellaneous Crenarchaeota group-1 archaeon SG8-32-1]